MPQTTYLIAGIAGSIVVIGLVIFGIVCRWKILEDRGIAGWKCLIPFYNHYAFGEAAEEKGLGKMLAILSGVMTLLVILPLLLLLMIVLANPAVLTNPGESLSSILNAYFTVLLVYGIICAVIGLWFFIGNIILRFRFTVNEGASGWFIILWILLPIIPIIYFAYIQDKVDPVEIRYGN